MSTSIHAFFMFQAITQAQSRSKLMRRSSKLSKKSVSAQPTRLSNSNSEKLSTDIEPQNFGNEPLHGVFKYTDERHCES